MVPTSVSVGGYTMQQGESTGHPTGTTEAGNMFDTWSLENNIFKITGVITTRQDVITSVRTFNFLQLVTEEFTYTKFKYIQE